MVDPSKYSTSHVGPATVLSGRRRIAFVLVLMLLVCVCGECGSRAFWALRGVPALTAQRMIHRSFYPELVSIENAAPRRDDEVLDILLLGGSVLHNQYGNIEQLLREELFRLGRPARVYNVAMPGQTSLDSFYKYRHLSDKTFDVVIVYHGINEVRANNCPPDVFRSDYSHYSWYRLINAWERAPDSRWFAGPYTLRFLVTKLGERLGWVAYVPTHEPRESDLKWGADLKTVDSFRRNLEGIVELARSRGQPVILMTFSYHLPPDYSRERFNRRALDYLTHSLPVELWGRPEHVAAAIEAHNGVVHSLAAKHGVGLVDQAALIPRDGKHFNDVCHLTHEGCAVFVENLVPAILEAVGERMAAEK